MISMIMGMVTMACQPLLSESASRPITTSYGANPQLVANGHCHHHFPPPPHHHHHRHLGKAGTCGCCVSHLASGILS